MKSRSRREARARSRARETVPPTEAASSPPEVAAPAAATPDAADQLDRFYVPAALLILLVAAVIRLPMLALNPLHHDEGINGYFTTNLLRDGVYAYDPANYHGPSLYYLALASATIFGLNTEAMRLVPVLAGLATVALVFPLRRLLGSVATLSAAALLAVSPGAVYVSRYFIHESLLVCFSLALVVSTLLDI